MLPLDGGQNRYAKFVRTRYLILLSIFSGGDVINSRLPKSNDIYGKGAFILVSKINEEKQFNKYQEKISAVVNGFELLGKIADVELKFIQKVYHIVYDFELLCECYNRVMLNFESKIEILNSWGISKGFFILLSEKLKTEKLMSRIENKIQLLEIGLVEDRIVQQSLLFLLEAGFKKNRQESKSHCKNVSLICRNIRLWENINWFIVSGIVKYLNTINYNKILELISYRFHDQQVLDLLWKYFRKEQFLRGKKKKINPDFLQNAIFSFVFNTVYLKEVDLYVNRLKMEFEARKGGESSPMYKNTKFVFSLEEKCGGFTKLRKARPILPKGFKIYYVRLRNNWFLGVCGSKKDAAGIRKRVAFFVQEFLRTELSLEKTNMTHAVKEKTFFLGYEISSSVWNESFFFKKRIKKESSSFRIRINAPYTYIKEKFIETNFLTIKNGKWLFNSIPFWTNCSHAEILFRYNQIIRNYLNYYSLADNCSALRRIFALVLRHSCALTLGRKYKKRSRKKIFKRFGKNLRDPKTGQCLAIPERFTRNHKSV